MNRESLPLIFALLIPIALVLFIFLNYYEYDVISFLRSINILYYIVIFPIVLGFVVIIVKFCKRD
jgi:hypothetical protein